MLADESALESAIATIEAAAGDRRGGLPLPIFLLFTRLLPLATVDLLIQDERGRTLLTWRDDVIFGRGWHIPGGAIRYKETIADRLHACAATELGAAITFDPHPLAVEEEIDPVQATRGHNLALLYRCHLVRGPDWRLAWTGGAPDRDQWAWHARCPEDMLAVHRRYARFFLP